MSQHSIIFPDNGEFESIVSTQKIPASVGGGAVPLHM